MPVSASNPHIRIVTGANAISVAGKRPWTLLHKVHIALPGATQNEVSKEEAEALVASGVKIVAEGSNMVYCRPFLHDHQDANFKNL